MEDIEKLPPCPYCEGERIITSSDGMSLTIKELHKIDCKAAKKWQNLYGKAKSNIKNNE